MRPIFVVGAPRAGTTLVGELLSNCKSVCGLGELGAAYTSHFLAKEVIFHRMPSPYREEFYIEFQNLAKRFAEAKAYAMNADFYCDSTPANLLAAKELKAAYPNALFILVLRHYSGVMQSLSRSYAGGYEWAGKDWPERAVVWSSYYANVVSLPECRTIVLSYDRLCAAPIKTIAQFARRLQECNISPQESFLKCLTVSHATSSGQPRKVIGKLRDDGSVHLSPIESYDRAAWEKACLNSDLNAVKGIDRILRNLYRSEYTAPPNYR